MKSSFPPSLSPEEIKYLQDMIEHHKMALIMSKNILRTTDDSDVMSIAYAIMLGQSNEISLMGEMIKRRK